MASLRLKDRLLLLIIVELVMKPLLPPPPIWRVPALMVVLPE